MQSLLRHMLATGSYQQALHNYRHFTIPTALIYMGWTTGVRFPAATMMGFVPDPASCRMGTGDSYPSGKATRAWNWPLTSI